MEIVFVRHALPLRIDATDDGSPADPGLAELGRRQAERVVQALGGDDVSAVYSSPSRRALETAAPFVAATGLSLQVEPGIAEFDSGMTSYVPVEELRAEGDARWEELVRGDLYGTGVDPVAFQAGVVAAVERIIAAHPGGRAVLFSHSGAINAWSGHLTGQDKVLWFAPGYCSVNRFGAARDGRRGVVSLNETGHVRDLLTRR